ncbi:hypothetical protein JXA47_14395 [Candidatus Sumerlaeota bacterium]|nr:hypothetical protein [Candidatus Sumerlaeota bacterium]
MSLTLRHSLFALALTLSLTVAVPSQVNPLDVERGNIVQTRYQIQDDIRRAYSIGDYQRVLDLCDELEALDPRNGRIQHYRTRALQQLDLIESGAIPAPVLQPSERAGAVTSPETVAESPLGPPPPPPPSPDTLSPPGPAPPVAEPAQPTPPAEPEPSPRPRRSSGSTIELPLLGEVNRSMALGALIAVVAVLVILPLLMRRQRRGRAAVAVEDDGVNRWAPPEEEIPESPFGEGEVSSALDEALSAAMEPSPQPATVPLRGVSVATLAAPWPSIDDAVEAIRDRIHNPPAPPQAPAPRVEERDVPLSLDAVAGPSIESAFSTAEPKSTAPPPVKPPEPEPTSLSLSLDDEDLEAPHETPRTVTETVDADDFLFEVPSEVPPDEEEASVGPSLDLEATPVPMTSPHSEGEPSAPMTTDDLLTGPAEEPASPQEMAEITGAPLRLDDLLGDAPSEPRSPAGITEGGIGRDSSPDKPGPEEEKPPKFDPADLEETIAIPSRPRGPSKADSVTLILEPDEIKQVLSEITPPPGSMSVDDRSGSAAPDEGETSESPTDTSDALFIDYYRQGLAAISAENWARAKHFLQLAQSIRPDSPEVLRHLRTAERASSQRGDAPGSNPTPGL